MALNLQRDINELKQITKESFGAISPEYLTPVSSRSSSSESNPGVYVRKDAPTYQGELIPVNSENGESSEVSEHSHTAGRNIIVIILVLLVGVIVFMIFQQKKMMDPNGGTASNSSNTSVNDYVNEDVFTITPEKFAEYAKVECVLDDDPALNEDPEIRKASGLCIQGEFEAAYNICEKYKNKYAGSIRFNMMRTLVTFATGNFKYGIDALTKITQNEPEAMCNPLIRDINYALIEDDKVFDLSMNVASALVDPGNSTRAVAWLLLANPCGEGRYKRVFQRDLAMYDAIDIRDRDPAGEWLYQAVYMWRQEGACEKTEDKVFNYIVGYMSKRCDPIKGDKASDPACTRCLPVFKERLDEFNARKKGGK